MLGRMYLVIITEEALSLGILILIIQEHLVLIIQDFHKELTDLMIHLQLLEQKDMIQEFLEL
jgi:hypothetical protein